MKFNSYEIKYNNAGVIISKFYNTKISLVENYIDLLRYNNYKVSSLKAFKNGVDITAKINAFLNK